MTMFFCPRCQTQCVVSSDTTDYVHDCSISTNETLANEDVLIIGNATDYDGEFTTLPGDVRSEGIINTLQGTRAWVEGGKNVPRTSRGNNNTMYRTRRHLEYIDLKEVKSK